MPEIQSSYTNHIPKFSEQQFNDIAEDCGLVLPLLNPDEIDKELDFFVKRVWVAAFLYGFNVGADYINAG